MRVSFNNRPSALLRNYSGCLAGAVVGWLACWVTLGGGGGAGISSDLSLFLPSSTGSLLAAQVPSAQRTWNDKSAGWSLVHVFYGTTDHLPYFANVKEDVTKCNDWFSQARQDELVYRLLNGKMSGYFVDIAANDAIYLSNTYALETRFNWRGICIEANSLYWPALSYRKCNVVGAVVANDREEVRFRSSNKELGGIVGANFDNKGGEENEKPRLTVTLLEVLRRFDAPSVIDYLSLDVEGAEEVVLQPAVLDHYQFNLVTIERPNQHLQDLLNARGYKLLKVLTDFKDTLFVRKDFENHVNRTALETVNTWHYRQYENTLEQCPPQS